MRRRTVLVFVCVIALLLSATGTACLRRPLRRPETTPSGTEPTITLLLEDKGQQMTLKMEQYLEGVVAAEAGSDAPAEALAAQAILARTFTVQRIQEKGGTRQLHGTDACTNPEHFQAYDASKVTDAVRSAVRSTRGVIITYQGAPALAWFHSNSGGMTATPEEGLAYKDRPVPYLTPVKDATTDLAPWQQTFTTAEIANAVRKLGKQTSTVKTVEIGKKGPSGRAVELMIDGQPVPAAELRTQLGSEKMRSTLLESVSVSGGKVAMKGKGWGHGVGMAQDGARALAQQGKRAAEIIAYYYKGVTIEKRWQ